MIFPQTHKAQWSLREKLILRFIFSYIILYILLLLLGFSLENSLRWFARNVLQLNQDFEVLNSGSGDRMFDFVRLAFNAIAALIIGLVWSALDRKRPSYNKLAYWFQMTLRLTLFCAMLLYGLAKIFKGQFPDPTLKLLVQPVGELSPMGLAWTFMGHSLTYNIFIGFAEVLGGLLVMFRRTSTLGGLIIMGVMANVAMMNLTYDIPVKLFSIHLVFMATVLVLFDYQRIVNAFLRNTSVQPATYYSPFNNGFQKVISVSKVIVTSLVLLATLAQCFLQVRISAKSRKPALYGIWEAETFIKGNDTIPPLITDSYRWRYLILDERETGLVKTMNDQLKSYEYETDTIAHTMTLYENNGSIPHLFKYSNIAPGYLQLQGTMSGDTLLVTLKQKPLEDFRLINRKFHWVNESPYSF